MDHKESDGWKFLKNNEFYNERIYKIYALIEPSTNTIFYIGCTIAPLHIRMSQHILDFTNPGKTKILTNLIQNGSFPGVRILYKISDKTKAKIAEKYLTHFLKHNKLKIDLKNMHAIKNISENINLAR